MVGKHDLWEEGTRYKVESVERHDDYNDPKYSNDIAIVEIDGTIEFNDKVQPIKYSDRPIEKDVNVQSFGWRRFGVSFDFLCSCMQSGMEVAYFCSFQDVLDANLLHVTTLKTISSEDCQAKVPKRFSEGHLCTKAEGDDNVCQVGHANS